jgi:hypothetical protein
LTSTSSSSLPRITIILLKPSIGAAKVTVNIAAAVHQLHSVVCHCKIFFNPRRVLTSGSLCPCVHAGLGACESPAVARASLGVVGKALGVRKIRESSSAKGLDFGGPRNAAHRVQGCPQ